jgi:paraquat-inducible protein B
VLWLVPLAALVVAAVLAWQAVQQRGIAVTIDFQDGAGLRAGDPISYRGVHVGQVTRVRLDEALQGVVVEAELDKSAAGLAVEGTRFWIVQPQISLSKISGLETLLGPRYIAVAPGEGGAMADFVGRERSPEEEEIEHDGLRIVLEAARAGSLSVGAPVTYREIRVGAITGVRLAPNGQLVLVDAVIAPAHAHLVRDNTVFFNTSGASLDVGFTGVTVRAESLSTIVAGGVAFATPTKAGEPVASGQHFALRSQVDDDWLEWSPDLGAAEASGDSASPAAP